MNDLFDAIKDFFYYTVFFAKIIVLERLDKFQKRIENLEKEKKQG